jgi:nuclear transport factor 2 (NTF2) superfamily protein
MIGVDDMINTIAHELTKDITDSSGAWFDAQGDENAGELNMHLLSLVMITSVDDCINHIT